jgi:hypothetical protein
VIRKSRFAKTVGLVRAGYVLSVEKIFSSISVISPCFRFPRTSREGNGGNGDCSAVYGPIGPGFDVRVDAGTARPSAAPTR